MAGGKIPQLNGGFIGKASIRGSFSGKPCVITGGYLKKSDVDKQCFGPGLPYLMNCGFDFKCSLFK